MSKKEAPLEYLQRFLPDGSAALILDYLNSYKVHLTITRSRKSILGDYRHSTAFHNHRISINGSLNKYAFLITLIHELAHLQTFLEFGNRVQSHGKEWKQIYRRMLTTTVALNIFPADILRALRKSMNNLPASSCADDDLIRVLRNYDANKGSVFVEQLAEGKLFKVENGQIFKKGKLIRKRIECIEMSTGKLYLFSPVFEVKAV
ncbi:MAG: SprT-like domain-containing protein [Chitinophagales bacterium]